MYRIYYVASIFVTCSNDSADRRTTYFSNNILIGNVDYTIISYYNYYCLFMVFFVLSCDKMNQYSINEQTNYQSQYKKYII